MKSITKLASALTLAFGLLASCGATPLAAPSDIILTDRALSWSEVATATSYNVQIDEDEVYSTPTHEFTLPDAYFGSLSIAVQTVSGTETSDYSAPVVVMAILHLSAPSNLRQEGTLIYWDEVPYATGYIVKINGIEYATTDTHYAIDVNEAASVQVLATGRNDGLIVSSPFSEVLSIKIPLAEPTGIVWDEGILSWDVVEHATGYVVTVNGGSQLTTETNSLDVGYDHVGEISFAVKATSTDSNYLASSFATAVIHIAPLNLATPTNLSLTDNLLTFDTVAHASGYAIYVNGSSYATTSTNSYTVPNSVMETAGAYLQVQATSSVHNASELSLKVYLGVVSITNESELRAMTTDGHYRLANDISLSGEWTPKAFSGVFDGEGYTISNMVLSTDSVNVGFFSVLDHASVSDVTLTGVLSVTLSQSDSHVGGLAGYVVDSFIQEIHVAMDLTVHSTNGLATVGGAIGTLVNSEVTRLTYEANITAENAIAGGLIGKAYDPQESHTLFQSGAEGSLVVSGGEQSLAGGFIGFISNNMLTISQCYARMNVTGTSYVGGFVAYLGSGHIENSYASGTITATETTIVHLGGFIGRTEGYNNAVSYCISRTTLVSSATGSSVYIGAFVGVTPGGSYATIYLNCVYDSSLTSRDRIGNPSVGRGDGISGVTSANLLTLSAFNATIWNFSGSYPTLIWES